MNYNLNKIIITLSVIFLTICGYINVTSTNEISVKDIKSPINIEQTGITGNIPVGESDFIVTDGTNSIRLDLPYKEFTFHIPEVEFDNNYVGEIYSGEYVYKVFKHEYPDFIIFTSNLNYNLKNRSFDEYYITQITIKNSNIKTSRGIAIGSKIEEVFSAYGYVEKSNDNGEEELRYIYRDLKLSFIIDENQNVKEIFLTVLRGD